MIPASKSSPSFSPFSVTVCKPTIPTIGISVLIFTLTPHLLGSSSTPSATNNWTGSIWFRATDSDFTSNNLTYNTDLIMNYAKDLKVFASNIDIIYDNLPSKYWGKMVMGIATYNQSPIDVINKIKYSKVTRFKSISFFSYNVIEQNPRYFPPIKKILYPK